MLAAIACACSSSLDINTVYGYDLSVMPVPKRIVKGETVEIRCKLIREGNYADTRYFIRCFQTGGKGELRLENGTLLTPNDLFPLKNEVFRLYYTSRCTDQQNFDIYIEDSNGQAIEKSFSFSNKSEEKEE